MNVRLSPEQLDQVLTQTDFSDLNTRMGGCTSFAAGVGRVIDHDGFIAPTDEDEAVIHAYVVVDDALFEAGGKQYDHKDDIVQMIHEYNPFGTDRYQPEHFPLQSLLDADDVDRHLLDERVVRYDTESKMPVDDAIATEVARRVEQTITAHGFA